MSWFWLIVCCCACVEACVRLRLGARLQELQKLLARVGSRLRSSAISDHWKERVMLRYSQMLLGQSLSMFGLLLICFSPFLLAVLAGDLLLGQAFGAFLVSFQAIVASMLVALVFLVLRPRIVSR